MAHVQMKSPPYKRRQFCSNCGNAIYERVVWDDKHPTVITLCKCEWLRREVFGKKEVAKAA